MHKTHDPDGIVQPFSNYSHAVETGRNLRWLYLSGQVGVTPDGRTAQGFEAQAEVAFSNVKALLEDTEMGFEDVVRLNVYVTNAANIPLLRDIRDAALGGIKTASTLVVVAALANPAWLIEVEAVAAKA